MTFCKFRGRVAGKTFFIFIYFLEINLLSAISGDLFVTVASIMAENDI